MGGASEDLQELICAFDFPVVAVGVVSGRVTLSQNHTTNDHPRFNVENMQ